MYSSCSRKNRALRRMLRSPDSMILSTSAKSNGGNNTWRKFMTTGFKQITSQYFSENQQTLATKLCNRAKNSPVLDSRLIFYSHKIDTRQPFTTRLFSLLQLCWKCVIRKKTFCVRFIELWLIFVFISDMFQTSSKDPYILVVKKSFLKK